MAQVVGSTQKKDQKDGMRWPLLVTVLLGTFLAVTDLFIVNVALPKIGASLDGSAAQLELVVAAYNVAYACWLVAGGRLGDTVGRRRMFIGGMLVFVTASALCGIAPTADLLIASRTLQGLAAAAMVPQVLATLQSLYEGPARARAISYFGATIGLSIVFGQVVGGLIVGANLFGLSWRPIFLLNIPIGVCGAYAAYKLLPETRSSGRSYVDGLGAVLLAASLASLLVPLAVGRALSWPIWCWLLFVLSGVCATAFVIHEKRAEDRGRIPLMPLSLMRTPGMSRGVLSALAYFPGAGGFLFTSGIILQNGRGLSPLRTGCSLASYALAFFAAAIVSRVAVERLGHMVIVWGSVLMAIGLGMYGLQAHADFSGLGPVSLIPAYTIIGAGNGLVMIPLFGVILGNIPVKDAGVASGVLSTVQQACLGLGAALFGTILFWLGPASETSASRSQWISGTVAATIGQISLAGLTVLLALRLRTSNKVQN